MKIFLKNLSIALVIIFSIYSTQASEAEIGKAAPDFTLTDSEGDQHSLSDFSDKVVVLEWINFDCPFVKKHYDESNMQSLQKEYTSKGVVWLSICSSADGKQGHFDNDEINKRINDHKANMTAYLIDEDGTVGKKYGARTTPHMYIIKDGKIVYMGGIDSIKSTDPDDINDAEPYVKNALNDILSGKEVSTKTSTPYGCSVKYK